MQDVFIIGSKGIPARYGGFETFVDKLTQNRISGDVRYHVACAVDRMPDEEQFIYNDAHCFNIEWKKLGPARAIFYDLDALDWAIGYAKANALPNPIFYVLACRIGPFISKYKKEIHALGGKLFVNPDGHEWLRAKWSKPVRWYWKWSENRMIKHADLAVCDSKTIENYIQTEYERHSPNTTYIAYGAEISKQDGDEPAYEQWLETHSLKENGYYLVVGRFVPENNYETMIREFMASDSRKDFVLVTGVNDEFLSKLDQATQFLSDARIKFVGTVYDQPLLQRIRKGAFAYLHGHEVGGTNPSLLEALAATRLNLLLDVGFNREVAEDAALYWSKEPGNLACLIEAAEGMDDEKIACLDAKSTATIEQRFSWPYIVGEYESLFLGAGKPSGMLG